METLAFYLLKSVIWLTGFTLVFILFLRNERFFLLNRIYLLTGILTSFLFPLVSIHYTVVLPLVRDLQPVNAVVSEIQDAGHSIIPDIKLMLLVLYVSGVLFVLTLIIKQGRSVLRTIKKSEIIALDPVKLIRTPDYTSAFSFFSYVFVNPSITDVETKEIVNHELVHIRQKHWFDLVLVELLCMMQWFNPLVWMYVRFIRQNHEYLADQVAMQRTSHPAIYRAALLNQIVGSPVFSLANSFNYSLNKKRFKMMKNIISSPYRKMKIFLILPVFAIVLYAFAKPDYKYNYVDDNPGNTTAIISSQQKEVKGTVVQQDGKPLDGAIITLRGTTVGTITDVKGGFKFNNVPDDGLLVVSYVGYKSKVLKPVFTSYMIINMVRDTVKLLNTNISTPPPPPPPPPGWNIKDEGSPLYVVDGIKVTHAEFEIIDPNSIESISVLNSKSSVALYGGIAETGVILITTKKTSEYSKNKVSETKVTGYATDQKAEMGKEVIIEELPEFPGGKDAMVAWINANIKYPGEAVKGKIMGKVYVNFVVSSDGKVNNVVVSKSVSPLLDAEAERVIGSMPDWKAGSQAGKPADVRMLVPVEFKLN